MHATNYTLIDFPDKSMSLYAFEALDVTVSNFTLQASTQTNKNVSTIVDNHFPYILIQSTDEKEGEYFVGNLSEGISGI
jgi:hypothetical protein